MNTPINEEKLTAYALGECPEHERKQIEAYLAENEHARQTVEDILGLASQLEQELGGESAPELTDEQMDDIRDASHKGTVIEFPRWTRYLGTIAASIAIIFVVGSLLLPSVSNMKKGQMAFLQLGKKSEDVMEVAQLTTDDDAITESDLKYAREAPLTRQVGDMKADDINSPAMIDGRADYAQLKGGAKGQELDKITMQDGNEADQSNQSNQTDPSDMSVMTVASVQSPLAAAPAQMGVYRGRAENRISFKARAAGKQEAYYAFAPAEKEGVLMERMDIAAVDCDLTAGVPECEEIASPSSQYGPSLDHYNTIIENEFKRVDDHPLSTFSIDVDTASYSNLRRYLKDGRMPPKDSVRIEEMINYFSYDYEPPHGDTPFATHLEMAGCPWNPEHRLVRIGIKGKVIDQSERPACNLVFLMDVSGSMQNANKLPLVQRALEMLVRQLDERDKISIVVYAGASGLVLDATSCDNPQMIIDALKRLRAGGSTNGGAGIDLAYKTAMANFVSNGVNRVILCTDGDFNVGVTQSGDLVRMVEEKAKEGVFLSVLGFGMGNYKDSTLEQLADKGNGNYAYIDTFNEARKVLVDQLTGTLVTIAKDVKIQVEFNPAQVAAYRLIGYENRMLNKEDFNDDKKDAGEIGAGHTITALYELIPVDRKGSDKPAVDPLKYQPEVPIEAAPASEEWMTVKLRYKQPNEDYSTKIEFPLKDNDQSYAQASVDYRFAAAVASFGMMLRDSGYKGNLTYDAVLELAQRSLGDDSFGYRRECIDLIRNAKAIQK